MSSRTRTAALVVAGVSIAAVAVAGVLSAAQPDSGGETQAAAQSASVPVGRGQLPASLAPVIERVSPAVVAIRVTGADSRAVSSAFELPEPFKRFFGDDLARRFGFDSEMRRGERRSPQVRSGVGSGFFIDADGHIVTNNHVVEDARKIEVSMTDGRRFEARIVGRDPKTDLALLKVDGGDAFPHVAFGQSSEVKVGDWIVAIGSPFGLGNTATTGIVSARGRDIGSGPYDDFLQIDAPINRGNSGGPSFNLDGEVVGVNTAILSVTGANAGIGFAVPSDLAREVVGQLKTAGRVARGWLGVQVQQVTSDLADGLGLGAPEGALVSQVMEDSPAGRAGLRQGDVIVAVDGKRIETMRELPRLVAALPADSTAKLGVFRSGSEIAVSVRIGAMPGAPEVGKALADKSQGARFGMTVARLDDEGRGRFGVASGIRGVVVVELDPSGIAASRGLRQGDVIRKVADSEVSKPEDILEAVEKAAGDGRKSLLMLIHRSGSDRYVALPLGNA